MKGVLAWSAAVVCAALALTGLSYVATADMRLEYAAKKSVAKMMLDPDAAQFRSLRVLADGYSVCGQVNGKNRFGAYVGYQWFIVRSYANGTQTVDIDDEGRSLASIYCDR